MKKIPLALIVILSFFILVTGCGFHLRGYFTIAEAFKELKILPNQPGDPFQRSLRQSLKMNRVCVVSENDPNYTKAATLTILNQSFVERTVAYGTDAQANRAVLELTICYQVTDNACAELIPQTLIHVQREFTINPNEVLATNNERDRVRSDLLIDASTQLMRQLSVATTK